MYICICILYLYYIYCIYIIYIYYIIYIEVATFDLMPSCKSPVDLRSQYFWRNATSLM